MQVSAATPIREHEKPMSWARAIVIATGFFFITAIMAGQLPSYMYTVSTLSTLARFEQGALDLALLALGFGLLGLEIAFLYDPRPLIPWPLFAAAGAAIAAVGLFLVYQVFVGLNGTTIFGKPGWPEYLPDVFRNGSQVTYWPNPSQSYLFHPAWFQVQSIDIPAVGMIAIIAGLGMLTFAVLTPFVLGNRLVGPARDLLVRFSLGLSFVILAIYLTLYTFLPDQLQPPSDGAHGPLGNALLFVALLLAMFALQVWLLPIMVANRARFMPAAYLHGVVGLIGSVAVPLLIAWAAVYPVVNAIHSVDANQFWVQCAIKADVPGSCTFTPFTGYIIAAIVFSMLVGLLFLGLYFWSTRRDTIVLGGSIGLLYIGVAATVIHVNDPSQVQMGLIIATSIAILAFIWTWATQREFAPTQAAQLGCVGQWLVLGTLLLIYLFGFAVFSLPNFFEVEALALFYQPGPNGLHDAFWALLLMGGLALLQMAILIRHKPMSTLRKFALWVLLVAVTLEMVGAIQGFPRDVLYYGIDAMGGGHAFFLAGMIFEAVGIGVVLYGALRAASRSIPWAVGIAAVTLVSAAAGFVIYNLPMAYPELVVFCFFLAMTGAFAYAALGPDVPNGEGLAEAAGAGEPAVVSR